MAEKNGRIETSSITNQAKKGKHKASGKIAAGAKFLGAVAVGATVGGAILMGGRGA